MISCPGCFAVIEDENVELHDDWHKANNLHAAGCGWLHWQNAQRRDPLHVSVIPLPCTCGLGTPGTHPVPERVDPNASPGERI